MPYNDETTGLEVVPLVDCVRYLESTEVSRVAFIAGGRLQLYPINYHWDGEAMVFRCEIGSPLAEAEGSEVVAEVDQVDLRRREGWSVVVRGVPTAVDPEATPELASRLRRLALYPWAGGEKAVWLRLIPAPMTGRILRRQASED